MGIIKPENPEVAGWQGLHLFHFAMSNCSQRVRLMLEEKQLAWTSHHIDLARGEHVSEWYQSINPKAVVPTLVHDGTVVVESTDILHYLEQQFPKPALLEATGIESDVVERCLTLSNEVQAALKVLSHEFLFKPGARKNPRELDRFQQTLRNQELLAFHRQFSTQGFTQEQIEGAIAEIHQAFAWLDARLKNTPWLAGEAYSIADIAWVVNVHRMQLMRFPLRRYPKLFEWYQRVAQRASYGKALVAYEPTALRGFFKVYSWFRVNLRRNPFLSSSFIETTKVDG